MAQITRILLSATKVTGAGNNWDITVRYTARFSTYEWQTANFTFRDGFVLWESDEGEDRHDDDQLTGVVALSTFNPSAASVQRTLTYRISEDMLDQGDDVERFYVVVRLRNLDLNCCLQTSRSGILNLNL